jgi:hypothetical protein
MTATKAGYDMELRGIEVKIGGEWRHIGKVGLCPQNTVAPHLEGLAIFYRAFPWKQAYSFKTKAVSVDVRAWDKARSMGAVAMVNYCADLGRLVVIDADTVSASPRVDLREHPEYRVPVDKCHFTEGASAINMGWTTKSVKVGGLRAVMPKVVTPASVAQTSMFNAADF